MSAVTEAVNYCLNRYIDQTRRLGISGTNMTYKNQHPDELKHKAFFDGGEDDEQPQGEQGEGPGPVSEEA